MTNKKRIMDALLKKPTDKVPYAARFDQWYNWHLVKESLPRKYSGWDAYDILRDIGAGIRPARYYKPGVPPPRVPSSRITGIYTETVKNMEVNYLQRGTLYTTEISTPLGNLRMTEQFTDEAEGSSSIEVEHFFKTVDDYPRLEHLYRNTETLPKYDAFFLLEKQLGADGVPFVTAGVEPVHHLMRAVMGYERFFYECADNPARVESLLETMNAVWADRLEVLAKSPAALVQIGGNWVDSIHVPVFKKYMLPWLKKACVVLHNAGKLTMVHVDGEMRGLLELFKETDIDVAEAVAPKPMTSVSIEEFAAAWKDHRVTIYGGLPSVVFEPSFSDEEFDTYVVRTIAAAKENGMVIGMGDNVPPSSDFSRIVRVQELIDNHGRY
jgi:uroporphyrinogen-III decarboxylase